MSAPGGTRHLAASRKKPSGFPAVSGCRYSDAHSGHIVHFSQGMRVSSPSPFCVKVGLKIQYMNSLHDYANMFSFLTVSVQSMSRKVELVKLTTVELEGFHCRWESGTLRSGKCRPSLHCLRKLKAGSMSMYPFMRTTWEQA